MVPHIRLISKLKAHGIVGQIVLWIASWLNNREQRVVLNGGTSNWKNVLSGVPQGSVLGPVLFLIYINDIDSNINCNIKKFADDTKLYGPVVHENACEQNLLQSDLDSLCKWADDWQMCFNTDKCKVMHTGYNNPEVAYTMENCIIITIDEAKDLGVIIHKSLNPSRQCMEAAKKANKVFGMIKRTFSCKTKEIILPL